MSVIGKTLKFTGGMLVGLGIGAVTALLLAPQSGELTKEQLQARIDEMLDAGRRAQRKTEDDLYSRWEAELAKADRDEKEQDDTNKALADAKKQAEEARKREEQQRKDAERHIEKARDELDKARKSI